MKINSFRILTATAIMLTAGAANANLLFDIYAGGTYGIGGHTLYIDHNHISQSSTSYGAILGMDIPMFRIELEYNYVDADQITNNIGMVNAYFKIPTPIIKPYIGAGIGATFDGKYTPKHLAQINTEDTIAYQGMLGITLNIPALPFNIDIEGRVLYVPDMFKIMENNTDLMQYEGRVKLRYVF